MPKHYSSQVRRRILRQSQQNMHVDGGLVLWHSLDGTSVRLPTCIIIATSLNHSGICICWQKISWCCGFACVCRTNV